MSAKEKAIESIKSICKDNKELNLWVGEEGSAKWRRDKELMTPMDWKHIGYVSALSRAFGITQKDMGGN